MNRLQQMTVFRRVVETGNITRAARDLAMSQPSVSRLVAELEQRLGAPLLLRSPRGLHATPAGETFYAETVRILDELEAAEDAVRTDRAEARGLVRITGPHVFFIRAVMPLIPEFLATHPSVQVEAMLEDRTVDLIGEGFDLALRLGPVRDSALIARRIGRVGLSLYASPRYLDRAGVPHGPAALVDHDCCVSRLGNEPVEWTLETRDGQIATVAPTGRFRANGTDAVRLAVEAGLGIGLLAPWSAADSVAAGTLVPVLPDWRERPHDVHLLWSGGRNLARRVRLLVEFLAERFAADPRLSLRD